MNSPRTTEASQASAATGWWARARAAASRRRRPARGAMWLAAALVTGAAVAGCGHGGSHWGDGTAAMSDSQRAAQRDKMVERVSSRLSLDATQRGQFEKLVDAMQAQRQALMPAGAPPREALRGLMAGNRFDRAGAQALVDGKLATVQSGAPSVIAAMGDFYDSLRPEQQQQVRDFMARAGGRGWRGHGEHRPG